MEDDIEEMELRPSGLLRSFTLRNNAARQVVNFMPSRQIGHNTVRLRRSNSSRNALLEDICDETMDTPNTTEKHADNIVREMEQHHHLMEDHPLSEELRREALRDLPQGLTMKRNVRAKLSASVSLRSKQRPISTYKRMKYRISFTWKRTREHFRELFSSIELWYEAIRNVEGHLGAAVGSYFHLLRWLFSFNLLLTVFLVCFVVVPQALHDKLHANETKQLSVLDFITGQGGLTDSLLFYGHYHDGHIKTVGSLHYYMPNAYFFTMFCLYLMFFAVLCYRTAYSYRRHFIEPAGGDASGRPLLAGKLFCAWDHATAAPAAAARHAHALYHEFKEILEEQNSKQVTVSWSTKLLRRVVNVLVTLLALGLVVGFEYGLWQLLDLEMDNKEIYISLLIAAVAALYPVILNFVVKLQAGGGRAAVLVVVSRAGVLPALTALVLLLHWQQAGLAGEQCWETRVGQECYRLVVLEALVSLLLLPAFELIRGLLYKCDVTGPPQFDIAYNSLTLIFNQAVLWVGMLFSPLLVVAVTLKFLLLFYVKKETALRTCHAGKKVWRAAQTHTVLLVVVSLSLFVSLVSLAALFAGGSSGCGALRPFSPVWSALSPGWSRGRVVWSAATRPGSVAFVLLALCACVYMVRARSLARASCARELTRLRRLHAKDRDFLLRAIRKVADGEWLYSPKAEESGEDSHTWKYLHEVRKPSNAGYHFDASRLSHSFTDRPKSYAHTDNRPSSHHTHTHAHDDGDTDSSFSWQGSSSQLNRNSGTP